MADLLMDELWEEITSSLQHMVLTFSVGVVEAVSLLIFHIPVYILHFLRLVINLILATFIGVSNVVHCFCYEEIPYLFNLIIRPTSHHFINFIQILSRISSFTASFIVWTFHQIILLAKLLVNIVTYASPFYSTSMDMLNNTFNYLVSSATSVLCIFTEKLQLVFHLILGFAYSVIELSSIYVRCIPKSLWEFLSVNVNKLFSLCEYISVFEETGVHVQSGFGKLIRPFLGVVAFYVIYLLTVVVAALSLRLIGRGEYDRRHFENQERR